VTRPLRGDDSKIILDEAVEFLEKAVQAKEPFLCVIWFHAPHLPLVATPEYRRLYAEHPESKQHYWGAISALDAQVGRLRAKLREWGVARDTMLWYASDNGPEGDAETVEFPGTAGPLRGRKASLFEGGVRVPAIVEWPARWKGKRTIGAPCSTSDYFPTILAALELQAPDARPIDGASLLPLLDGKAKQRGSALAFETTKITRGSPRLAWVEDRWKLLTNLDASEDLLFDLQADPGEKRNLAASQPAEVARMRQALTVWRESCRRSVRGEDYQP
jgi:arylsulfatase A-like enzyme